MATPPSITDLVPRIDIDKTTQPPVVAVGIRSCARCGDDHGLVTFTALTIPFAPVEANGVAWTHWAPCPDNGEPILLAVT